MTAGSSSSYPPQIPVGHWGSRVNPVSRPPHPLVSGVVGLLRGSDPRPTPANSSHPWRCPVLFFGLRSSWGSRPSKGRPVDVHVVVLVPCRRRLPVSPDRDSVRGRILVSRIGEMGSTLRSSVHESHGGEIPTVLTPSLSNALNRSKDGTLYKRVTVLCLVLSG